MAVGNHIGCFAKLNLVHICGCYLVYVTTFGDDEVRSWLILWSTIAKKKPDQQNLYCIIMTFNSSTCNTDLALGFIIIFMC